jgi:hypothetical protein
MRRGQSGSGCIEMTSQVEEKVVVRSRRRPKIWLLIVLSGGFMLATAFVSYHWKFPYGMHHRCILILSGALQAYADDHNGVFPSGGSSPEASLSLLQSGGYANAELLAGKTASASAANRILSKGGSLGADSCSWHYVEGLTTNDDTRLAILWDKVGLGHDGQRLRQGGHEVIFIGGDRRFIAGKDWALFIQAQNELLAERAVIARRGSPVLTGEIDFGRGAWQNFFASPYTLWSKTLENYDKNQYVYSTMTSPSTNAGYLVERTGSVLMPSALTWFPDDVPQAGAVEFTLIFTNLRSWPVVVEFRNGKPDQASILFQMSDK